MARHTDPILSIGQLAGKSGFGIETIRFYERNGLIDEPPRKSSGYRQYPENAISRLQFIRRAKELGFSLKEIKELLSLGTDPTTTCADIRSRAEAKIADIEGKIQSLKSIKSALTRLTKSCGGKGPVSECPIWEALERKERR